MQVKLVVSKAEGIWTSTFLEEETFEADRRRGTFLAQWLCARHFIYILFAFPSKEVEVLRGVFTCLMSKV